MSIKDRGFASMSKKKQRQIASMGGKAVHALGLAHRWTKETAKAAGRKGGNQQYANKLERLAAARVATSEAEGLTGD